MKKQTKATDPADYESIFTKYNLYELDTVGRQEQAFETWTSRLGGCTVPGCCMRACDDDGYCEEHAQ